MVSIGLPWMLVQSVAWLGMAVTYSMESGSLVQGLSDTFDGNHPCPLCKAVRKNFETEKQPVGNAPAPKKVKEGKLVLGIVKVPSFIFPPRHPGEWGTTSENPGRMASKPETPPPEAAV